MQKKIRNIIFDLDGTLIDVSQGSYYLHLKCCNEFNIKPLNKLLYLELKANGVSETQILHNKYSLTSSQSSAFLALRSRDIESKDVLQNHQLKEGTIELLEYLQKSELKIYLATFRRNISHLLDQLNNLMISKYFYDVKCRASFNNYEENDKSRMVRAWKLNLNETLMVGDTMVDARTAEMLGMQKIILKDGIFAEAFLAQKINVNNFHHLSSIKNEVSKLLK